MITSKNITKVRMHDAICGVIYLSSFTLAATVDVSFAYIGIATGILQVISPVTKFCPVYFILNKMMPDSQPIQNGK